MRGEEKFRQVAGKKIKGKKVDKGRLHIKASYNNTILTLSDMKGDVVTWTSAGMLGFSGPKRATPYAAIQAARALGQKIEGMGMGELEVYVNGIGSGPEAAIRALASDGFNITFIKNVTPIPHGGPRPPKPRRV
ncbi:MAG: 30S ribosomal protein S11 [Candidatus Colwellbacteria bacterium]|nr:30S ribosomal protein S11 [Candidatus Colwellbacteria bacterium]